MKPAGPCKGPRTEFCCFTGVCGAVRRTARLAQMEYIALQRWEEAGEMALGLWLIAAPYLLGYSSSGMLRFWHTGIGGVVFLLAVLKLWQDWNLTDQELANHGQ